MFIVWGELGTYQLHSDLSLSNDGDARDADPFDPGDSSDGTGGHHGSHVAGIAAARITTSGSSPAGSSFGMVGVAPSASLLPVRASYSNYGAFVDGMAPGGDFNTFGAFDAQGAILGPWWNAGSKSFSYQLEAGTSMAAPHIAGLVALMKSVVVNPADINTTRVLEILWVSGTALSATACKRSNGNACGAGLIDAVRALGMAAGAVRFRVGFAGLVTLRGCRADRGFSSLGWHDCLYARDFSQGSNSWKLNFLTFKSHMRKPWKCCDQARGSKTPTGLVPVGVDLNPRACG